VGSSSRRFSLAQLRINVILALDGIGPTHDAICGVPGNFERDLESLAALWQLHRREERLRLHVNSVVCRENLREMVALGELLRERLGTSATATATGRASPQRTSLRSRL
jgi:MoaA/NifB/PqqE/SkfB family radical SAM enzyme